MAPRVVLHVGSMKSGTSYLQALLFANQRRLASRGVVVPGKSWPDQVAGVNQVLGRTKVGRQPSSRAWESLVEETLAADGAGIISMEFLGPANPAHIDTVVSSFGGAQVEVVITGRDLGRNVPAMWQEAVKNGYTRTFADFVEAVRVHEGRGRAFWRQQGLAAMCRRWADRVGMENVTLVTVPPRGAPRDELWARFATAVRVEPAGIEQPAPTNESLGAASVEVVRRLNQQLRDLDFQHYAPVVKHRLTQRVLASRRAGEPTIGFQVPDWLPPLSERMRRKLSTIGVEVVGSLDDLVPVSTPGIDPGMVDPADTVEASVAGMAALVRWLSAES